MVCSPGATGRAWDPTGNRRWMKVIPTGETQPELAARTDERWVSWPESVLGCQLSDHGPSLHHDGRGLAPGGLCGEQSRPGPTLRMTRLAHRLPTQEGAGARAGVQSALQCRAHPPNVASLREDKCLWQSAAGTCCRRFSESVGLLCFQVYA